MILAVAGAMTMAAAGLAVPAAAATVGVYGFGNNTYGELGNGGTTSATVPVRVPGLNRVTQVAADNGHVLVRRSDGTVAGWGDNYYGELGDGTTLNRLTPVQAQVLTGITQIATGYASYAIRSDGTLFSWGSDFDGLLGDGGTGGYTTTPAPVPLSGVTQLATNDLSTLALVGSTGRVFAWGGNACGQLGDGTTVTPAAPKLIGLTGVTQIAVSADVFDPSSSAIRYDGTLWTWGCNDFGQLDNGASSAVARHFLRAAADAFDELGSVGWAEQVRSELGRLGVKSAPDSELTAAERRVAALAAEGMSNKQIAQQLFTAVHTVEVHLVHAYAKLGVRSRAQLASQLARPTAKQAED